MDVDPSSLSLVEVRSRRQELQTVEDAVSYARRVAQTRLDLVRRRISDDSTPLTAALPDVLGQQAVAPSSGRPPRDTGAHETSAPAVELDTLCAERGFSRLDELDEAQLSELAAAIAQFERRISDERRRLFDEIDALSDELVRRYRAGEASVDSLWSSADRADADGDGDDDRADR